MTLECDFCLCECGIFTNGESCSTDCYVQTPENWDKPCSNNGTTMETKPKTYRSSIPVARTLLHLKKASATQ